MIYDIHVCLNMLVKTAIIENTIQLMGEEYGLNKVPGVWKRGK